MKTHPKITSQLSQTTVTLRKSTVQQEIHHHHKLYCALYHVLFLWRHMATVILTHIAHSVLTFLKYCFCMWQDKQKLLKCPECLENWARWLYHPYCASPRLWIISDSSQMSFRKGGFERILVTTTFTIIKTEIIDLMQRLRALWWSGWRG